MTKSIACNNAYDIFADASRNLAMVSGIDACQQNCRTAMSTLLNEMVYDTDGGVAYQETVFDNYDPLGFETSARLVLRAVPDVLDIVSFDVSFADNQLTYTATISTIYGEVTISG